MSSVLQEGHPIYQDTRDGLPVGWAAGDEAFLSGVGNPPAPEALPASDLSVQLQFWSQYQAEHQRAPTELLSGYCPGTGGCCITLVGLYGGPSKSRLPLDLRACVLLHLPLHLSWDMTARGRTGFMQ